MVYGTTLKLPGQFFVQQPNSEELMDPTSNIDRLKSTMNNVVFQPPRVGSQPSVFVHPDLRTCSHVFVRHDATKPPLQPRYNGPYRVLERKERFFVIEHGEQVWWLVMDLFFEGPASSKQPIVQH